MQHTAQAKTGFIAGFIAAWKIFKTVLRWWLVTLGPFILSCASLVSLRCGLLKMLHNLYFKALLYLLPEEPQSARPYDNSYLSAAEWPLQTLALISVVCQAITLCLGGALSADLSASLHLYSRKIMNFSAKVCAGWFLYRVVNIKIHRSSRGIAKKSDILGAETSRQESQAQAVGQVSRVLVCSATFLACLPDFHVDIGTLLSFCGMGGLAISLVSKGVFVNLIGCLTIYLTQPFTLGDWIQTPDGEVDGWVQSVGPYHTVVMRWDRRPLYVPNSQFTHVQIVNCSRMTNRRILMEIPVRFSDIDKIPAIIKEIKDLVENHKKIDVEQHRLVRLRNLAPHAAMIWVSCYTVGISLKEYVDVREGILLSIKNIFFKIGTTFATTLEREARRVDATGAFLGAPYDASGVAPAPEAISASPEGDEEVFRKPASLLASQKALLTSEVQDLKEMQSAIWDRERALRDKDSQFETEQKRLQKDHDAITERHKSIAKQQETLEESLRIVAEEEDKLQAQEDDLDAQMDELKAREDALDHTIKEMRTQAVPETQLADEEKLEEAGRKLEERKEELSVEKKDIEQKRESLKEQKAAVKEEHEEDPTPPDAVPREDAAPEEGDDVAKKEGGEGEEPANYRKIAEDLGGE